MAKSYYDVLGVAKDVDGDAITKAYRKLARKYHPDVTKDPDGEEKFKEVGEAYEVLKDPAKRATYDRVGTMDSRGEFYNTGTTGHVDLDEILRRMRDSQYGADPNAGSSESIQKVSIPVDTMINGGQATFRYVVQKAGGMVFSFNHNLTSTVLEPNTKVGTRVKLDNVPNTTFILVPGGTTRCAVQGLDIVVPFDVNALAAAVGNKCKVIHPNGKAYDVAVPLGAKNGMALRLPRLGLSHINGAVGNLIAVVNYVVPYLTAKEQEALKKLLDNA